MTVTKNEILTSLNKPEDYILASSGVAGRNAIGPRPLRPQAVSAGSRTLA